MSSTKHMLYIAIGAGSTPSAYSMAAGQMTIAAKIGNRDTHLHTHIQ